MEKARLFLEFLKVILSPQVMALSGFVVFFLLFRDAIKALFARIAKIRFPGGSEVLTTQVDKTKEDLPPKGEEPPIAPASGVVPSIEENAKHEAKAYKDRFDAERVKAYLWEYRYLNLFLARSTQVVLDWFASLPQRTTVSAADSYWLPFIPSQEERRAILNALQAHYLVLVDGDFVEISPKGREYREWRGPLTKL